MSLFTDLVRSILVSTTFCSRRALSFIKKSFENRLEIASLAAQLYLFLINLIALFNYELAAYKLQLLLMGFIFSKSGDFNV